MQIQGLCFRIILVLLAELIGQVKEEGNRLFVSEFSAEVRMTTLLAMNIRRITL